MSQGTGVQSDVGDSNKAVEYQSVPEYLADVSCLRIILVDANIDERGVGIVWRRWIDLYRFQ